MIRWMLLALLLAGCAAPCNYRPEIDLGKLCAVKVLADQIVTHTLNTDQFNIYFDECIDKAIEDAEKECEEDSDG